MRYCRVYINCHLFLSWLSGLEILYPDPTQHFLFSGLGLPSPFCPGWRPVSVCKALHYWQMRVCSCLKFTINIHTSKFILCLKRYFLLVFSQHKHSNKQRNKQTLLPATQKPENTFPFLVLQHSASALCSSPYATVYLRLKQPDLHSDSVPLDEEGSFPTRSYMETWRPPSPGSQLTCLVPTA